MKNRITAAAATMSCVLFTLVVAEPARAAPVDEPAQSERTIRIATDGLDLTSARGAALLERRIRVAAAKVCEPQVTEPLHALGKRRRCYASKLADGLMQMDRMFAGLETSPARSYTSLATTTRPTLAD